MHMKTKTRISLVLALMLLPPAMAMPLSQTKQPVVRKVTTDKADADRQVFQQLAGYKGGQLIMRPLVIADSLLAPTREDGVMLLRGTAFQIAALRSDVYIEATTHKPIFSKRYPMESAVNLLMNVMADGRHTLQVTQHMYGKVKKTITLPMKAIYQVLAADRSVYCNVTKIDKDGLEADLVMYHKRRNDIHLFTLRMDMDELFKPDGKFTAQLYANIPQDNIRSIFSTKDKKRKK